MAMVPRTNRARITAFQTRRMYVAPWCCYIVEDGLHQSCPQVSIPQRMARKWCLQGRRPFLEQLAEESRGSAE